MNTLEDDELEGVEDIIIVMDMLNNRIVVSFGDNTTGVIKNINKAFEFYPNPIKEKFNI